MVTIYFSGTGNSQFIAKKFSELMKCDCYSIEEKVDFKKIISENDKIALCFPIHFTKAPIFFNDFVKKHKEVFKGKSLIIFSTQQFCSGYGAKSITFNLENVNVIYAENFNMQNNLTTMPTYYKLTKLNNEKCLKRCSKKLIKIVNDINNGIVKLKGFGKYGEYLGNKQHIDKKSLREKQKNAVRVDEDCILCNKCVKQCPTENLFIQDKKILHKEKCTFCFRCVNTCPKQAITVSIHKKVKEQYCILDKDIAI